MSGLGPVLRGLARCGVALHKDPAVARRVRLTNAMSLTLAAVVLAYFPIIYAAGVKLLAWTVLFTAAAYLSVLPLNHFGFYTAARLALVTFLNGAIFFYSGYLGMGAGGHLYLLATACLPIIIASVRERAFLVYGVGLSISFFEILTLFRDRVFPPPIITPLTQLWIHRAAVVPTTFLILLAELIYFSVSNERAEERLERNREFRALLDNAGQGFLTVDKDGRIGSEWSRIIEAWLGELKAGSMFSSLLRPIDEAAADWFEVSWETLFADRLPLEVALEQLPQSLQVGEIHLGIEYRPFFDKESGAGQGNVPDRVLIVISNITSDVERRRAEAAQHEVLRMVEQVMRDRIGFAEFQRETTRLLDRLATTLPLAEQKLIIHTLKGSCALFGATSVAELCESLEDRIADLGVALMEDSLHPLRTAWDEVCKRMRPIINGIDSHIELREEEHRQFLDALRRRTNHRDLLRIAESWRLEPIEGRLERMAEQIRVLSRRLEKGNVEVTVSGGSVRLDPARWAPFFSAFVHVLRNCVDHGLETPEERSLLGKPPKGRVHLFAQGSGPQIIIGISDDGRGIDWQRVKDKALALGLPAETQDDLQAALYANGLSTKDEITDTSGRGVGLSAVHSACEAMGGRIFIKSQRGRGTCFEFHIPLDGGMQAAHSPLLERGASARVDPCHKREGAI